MADQPRDQNDDTPSGALPVQPLRVCVVGSGTRFLSGISVYTIRLANALAVRHHVSLITLRRLLPDRLYPGRRRVGLDLTELKSDPGVEQFDGIDWFWLPSMPRALAFLARHRPEVLILQWWTGAVLHTYLALALVARLFRVRIVIEFHEVIDTGEARVRLARAYASLMGPIVLRLASGFAVHSEHDRDLVHKSYRLGRRRPTAIIRHGLYDHYLRRDAEPAERAAPLDTLNLLFFGIIRPYKGLEILVRAFDAIPADEIGRYWLTVVGETWEGWSLPEDLIEASHYRDRISFVNQYVTDRDLDLHFRGADAVILPYLRSSISGPLHIAMGYGLPIVMSDVGGNAEAAMGYGGIELVPPGDVAALRSAIERLPARGRDRYQHPQTWDRTAAAYDRLFSDMGLHPGPASR